MANEKSSSNRLGGSATYSIGGRHYQTEDISRLRPQTKEVHTVSGHEHDPRNIAKRVENRSGKIQTEPSRIHVEEKSDRRIIQKTKQNSEELSHKITSLKTSKSVASPATPEVTRSDASTHEIKPSSPSAQRTQSMTSDKVKTEKPGSLLTEARESALHIASPKNDWYDQEKAAIHRADHHSSDAAQARRTDVEPGWKPEGADARSNPNTAEKKESIEQGGLLVQPKEEIANRDRIIISSGRGTLRSFLSPDKVKTASERFSSAESSIKAQTKAYHKNGTYDPEKNAINSAYSHTPKQSDAIKTSSNPKTKPETAKKKDESIVDLHTVVSSAENAVLQSDDVGTSTARGLVDSSVLAVDAFRTAQKIADATPTAVNETAKIVRAAGKGTYHVIDAGVKGTVTIAKSAHLIHYGQFVPISKDSLHILQSYAASSGLNNTLIAKRLLSAVRTIKTKAAKGVQTIIATSHKVKTGVQAAKSTTLRGIQIVRGATTGTIHLAITREMLKRASSQMVHQMKTGLKTVATGTKKRVVIGTKYLVTKGVPTTTKFVVKKAAPKTAKIVKRGALSVAEIMTSSEDAAVQSVGQAAIAGWTGVKTAVTGVKAGSYMVKTSAKSVKKVARVINFVKQRGLKAAAKKAAEQLTTGAMNLLLSGVKALGMKLVLPIVIIGAVALAATSVMNSPTTIVSSLFGGTFSMADSGDELHVRDYLSDSNTGVGVLRQKLARSIDNQIQASKNSYDIVRLYATTGNTAVVDPSYTGVLSILPTMEESVNMLQPLYNAIILMDYDLSPTEAQAKTLLETLYNKLFRLTSAATTEQCGQNLATGEGTVTVHDCGNVHALSDCPNPTTGTHTSFKCSDCDEYYYLCKGHKGALKCSYTAHTHAYGDYTSACYSFTCTLMVHTHGDYSSSCYVRNCMLQEHAHEIHKCYTMTAQGMKLSCPIQVHTHSGSCNTYTLVCPFTEHTHGYNSTCYSFTCPKVAHSHAAWVSKENPGCYYTNTHSGELTTDCGNSDKHFRCTGYRYCSGHSVYSYTLNLDGVYALVAEYFTNPINELLAISNRTEEQNTQLDNLQTYYDIFNEMMIQVSEEWGGGLSASDLSGVQFVNGTRVGCQAVVNLAKSQIGQAGGQPYWSYYGFGGRVEWCGCFVHWCMRHTSEATAAWPDTENNAYCPTIANWFKNHNQWGDRNFLNLVPGDVILFDWEGDGVSDHIGIVIGRDDSKVYTVEGNSNDKVALRSYPIGSSVIYGYGLLNFGS